MKQVSSHVQIVLQALADPTRQKLLETLAEQCQPCTCTDTCSCNGPSMSTICACVEDSPVVSPNLFRHMKKLEEVGLLTVTKRGRTTHCALNYDLLAACAIYFTNLSLSTP